MTTQGCPCSVFNDKNKNSEGDKGMNIPDIFFHEHKKHHTRKQIYQKQNVTFLNTKVVKKSPSHKFDSIPTIKHKPYAHHFLI